jgi:hypothetical protein
VKRATDSRDRLPSSESDPVCRAAVSPEVVQLVASAGVSRSTALTSGAGRAWPCATDRRTHGQSRFYTSGAGRTCADVRAAGASAPRETAERILTIR